MHAAIAIALWTEFTAAILAGIAAARVTLRRKRRRH